MSASPLSSVLGFNLSSVIWYKPLNENWNDKPHSFEREVADKCPKCKVKMETQKDNKGKILGWICMNCMHYEHNLPTL